MDYSELSDFCLRRKLIRTLFPGVPPSHSFTPSQLRAERGSWLRDHHPDKNADLDVEARARLEDKCKDFNALWEECQRRGFFTTPPSSPNQAPPPSQHTPTFDAPPWPFVLRNYFRNPPPSGQVSCIILHAPWVRLPRMFNLLREKSHLDYIYGPIADAPGEGLLGFLFLYKHKFKSMQTLFRKEIQGTWWQLESGAVRSWTALKTAVRGLLSTPDTQQGAHRDDEEGDAHFNQQLLNEFALALRITDPSLLLGMYYAEIARSADDCYHCQSLPRTDPHHKLHLANMDNARLFCSMRAQKQACQNAVDCVVGALRLESLRVTPEAYFRGALKEALEKFHEGLDDASVAAAVLLHGMLPQGWNAEAFAELIHTRIVQGEPKRRGIIFRGAYDTGKSSLAAAIVSLFKGVYLNVNCTAERIGFELGQAIDQRLVCFDDVLGRAEPAHGLHGGNGMRNLDALRDHLDGAFPVGLEKKHHNKVQQVFPPWIVTCNEYEIPDAVARRAHVLPFIADLPLFEDFCSAMQINRRFINTGVCLAGMFALYCGVETFEGPLRELVYDIKREADTLYNKTDKEAHLFCQEAGSSPRSSRAYTPPLFTPQGAQEVPDLRCHETLPPSPSTSDEDEPPRRRRRTRSPPPFNNGRIRIEEIREFLSGDFE